MIAGQVAAPSSQHPREPQTSERGNRLLCKRAHPACHQRLSPFWPPSTWYLIVNGSRTSSLLKITMSLEPPGLFFSSRISTVHRYGRNR